jgi:hypothetical protein
VSSNTDFGNNLYRLGHGLMGGCVDTVSSGAVTPKGLGCCHLAGAVSASKLLQLLGSQGDKIGAQELGKVLQVLTGTPQLQEVFPDGLDAALFSSEVLGFEE